MNGKYNVVFKGALSSGADEHLVKANLVTMLKLTEHQVNRLFSAKPVIVKKEVNKELGQKYLKSFLRAGAVCELKKITPEFSLVPDEEKHKVKSVQNTCPQCGCEQQHTGLCDNCRNKLKLLHTRQTNTQKITSLFTEEKQAMVKESLMESLKDWVKSNMIKAVIILILLPLFGSRIVLSAVFFSQDKHLMYQTLAPQHTCADVNKIFKTSMGKKEEVMMSSRFFNEFTIEEKKENLQKWNNIACRSEYSVEIGNIGSEVIGLTELSFNFGYFVNGRITPPLFLDTSVRDISAASPREEDPEFIKNKGEIKIINLYPGTFVKIYFSGWVRGPEGKTDWDQMLDSVNIDEGKIDIGSPSSTTFAKLLTVFF